MIDEEIMMTSNRFDDIMEILQKMKKEWLSKLNSLKLKVKLCLFRHKMRTKIEKMRYMRC